MHAIDRESVLDTMNHQRQFNEVVNLGTQQLVPSSQIGFAVQIVLTGWFKR